MRTSAAAAAVGTTLLAGAAALIVAQAWTEQPKPLAELTHVIAGVIVALLVVAALILAARARALAPLILAATFGLGGQGIALALQGASVGALLAGLAPIVAALAHVALAPTPIAPARPSSDRIDIAWAIARSRLRTARAARRAASPSPLAMRV